jgi:hypothetical protein
MSESSEPTSSQLDDIELAESRTKTYEHHTDVGFLFGEEKQRWSLPVMPARESPCGQSSSTKGDAEYDFLCAPAVENITPQKVSTRPRTEDAAVRVSHDSGAGSDGAQHAQQALQRRTQALSEASEDGFFGAPEPSCSYTVTVDVLSTAFSLNERSWQQGYHLGKTPADVICQRTCTGLGVDQSSLTYFELREVPASQLRPSGHYAVAIDRSGAHFLRALT